MSQDPVSLLRLFEDGESATNITDGMLKGVRTAGVNLYSIFFPGLWSSLVEAQVSEKLHRGGRAPFRVRRLSWRKAHDSIIVPYVSLLITKLKKILKPFPLRVHHSWDSRFSRYVLAATLVDENKRPLIFILPFFFNCQAAFVHDIIVTCVSRYWLQPTHSAHLCPEICVSRCMHHPTNYEVSS